MEESAEAMGEILSRKAECLESVSECIIGILILNRSSMKS